MSRSTQITINDPAKMVLKWNSEKGIFIATPLPYDKEGKKYEIKLPTNFIVLDELQTVKGWSNKYESGIYSNLWRLNEPGFFKVKVNKGGGNEFPIVGHWKRIKDTVKAAGGKWCMIIFALMKSKSGYDIVRIELKGAAVSDYIKLKNTMTGAISVKETTELHKLGKTFLFPKFSLTGVSQEVEDAALKADEEVQEYLKQYFDLVGKQSAVSASDVVDDPPDDPSDLNEQAETKEAEEMDDFGDTGDLPFN